VPKTGAAKRPSRGKKGGEPDAGGRRPHRHSASSLIAAQRRARFVELAHIRRPLAACRAALIATLLPDPGDPEKRRKLCEKIGGKVVKKIERKKMPNGSTVERVKEETEGGILHWGRETSDSETLDWFRAEIRKAYGGRAPCWGHSMINAVFDRFAASARRIVVCDFHTGYGPYGYGIPLWHLEAGAKLEQARRLFGPTLEAPLSGDRSGDEFIQHGHFYQYCISALPHAEVIPMCFEFGGEFVSDEDGFERAIEEAAAWRDGVNDSARQAEARSLQRQVLAPAKADWREMVWFRGRQVLRELVAGISG